ncbi:MAG: hypothetical protein HUJ26_10175 [Planctomycetaceae bacterium]|nr:hypothetical protein [Planctomycetaceae bacterium]
MNYEDVETKLHSLTNTLVHELISLTPESMSEIQFEILSTDDGGADVGLLETHPDAKKVALSDAVFTASSHYLPLVKQYVNGWQRTLISLQEGEEGWQVNVEFEQA